MDNLIGRTRFVFEKNRKKPTEDKEKPKEYKEKLEEYNQFIDEIQSKREKPLHPTQLVLGEGFIELYGVTKPLPTKEILFSNRNNEKNEEPNSDYPVLYEYVWSVGLTGDPMESSWCEELDKDDSIVVQLIFHTGDSCFSIREIAADLKQMPPFEKKKGIGTWVESLRPAIGTFGKGLESLGVAGPGKIISMIAETKLNTASTEEFPWWIKTISAGKDPGLEWHISRSYLHSVGNRFVGTLVAYFVDCTSGSEVKPEKRLDIEIRVYLKSSSTDDILFISHLDNDDEKSDAPKFQEQGLSHELFDSKGSTGTKLKIVFD